MPDFSDIWDIEKQLWTGPAESYDKLMAPGCVMVFPLPAGIIKREKIMETVKLAPRWEHVEFDHETAVQSGEDTVTLAYVGRGLKDRNTYEAYCSSTYVKSDKGWQIVQHQQTPA